MAQVVRPFPAAVAFGSAEEFASSDDPHCIDGGKACIDCLVQGQCLVSGAQAAPADKNPAGDCSAS